MRLEQFRWCQVSRADVEDLVLVHLEDEAFVDNAILHV